MKFKNLMLLIIISINLMANIKNNKDLLWTSINVSTPKPQGDAHVIIKNGKTLIIDGGEYNQGKKNLISYLKKNKIYTIDEILITHTHFDHYGGIIALLESNLFKIKKLYMNMPTKKQMKKEWWSGKYEDLIYLRKLAKKRDIPIYKIKQGDIFRFDKNTYMKVLYIYDLNNTPIKNITINDMSAVTMIYDYEHKYLLTGDLDKNIGAYLAKNANNLKADILKVPHHGVSTLPPKEFFDKVASKYYIITSPDYFWLDPRWKRSDQIKKYVKEHNITTYITGINGDITVISNKNGFHIKTNPPKITTLIFNIKILESKNRKNTLQIFYSNNQQYSENNSQKYIIDKNSTNKDLYYRVSVYNKEVKFFRIDPLNSKGKVVISNVYIESNGKKRVVNLTKISNKKNLEIISSTKDKIEIKATNNDPILEILNNSAH